MPERLLNNPTGRGQGGGGRRHTLRAALEPPQQFQAKLDFSPLPAEREKPARHGRAIPPQAFKMPPSPSPLFPV